jgi:hypothetical protein
MELHMPNALFESSTGVIKKVTLPHVSILDGSRSSAIAASAKAKPQANTTTPAALILVGLDDQGKPHAAWFTADQVDAATLAAEMMDMASIDVGGSELAALAGMLPKGKLFESGKAFVPFTKRDMYDRLAGFLDEDFVASTALRVEAAKAAAAESYAKASKGEAPLHLPEDWSKLAVGDLVLATEDPDEGWWPCEVVAVLDNKQFRLRWRDFPDQDAFIAAVTDIALVHPQCKSF